MAHTRVYILAKELGVKSAAIVKKCQDEDLDVKNHMSVISAGLAATIKEWFSEGENVTTVETTQKVDLKKVRLKKKVVKSKTTKKKAETEVEQIKDEVEATEQTEIETEAEVKPKKASSKRIKKAVVKKEEEEKKEPKPIEPAGPMMEKPKPAKLSGPQLVRVEELTPEFTRHARPKHRKPRHDVPITEPLMRKTEILSLLVDLPEKGKKDFAKHGKEKFFGRKQTDKTEIVKKTKSDYLRRQRDVEERRAKLSAADGSGFRIKPLRKIASKSHQKASQVVRHEKATMSEPITVKDLSFVLAVKISDIIAKLMQQGVMATANQNITADVAELVALEFGTELTVEHKNSLEEQIQAEFKNRKRENVKTRSVVVAMLGHVDHGKTSLLDKIRTTQVAAGEAGGITQHIGAYQVNFGEHNITFLDTPGHEAFTAMRARGANMTDVVVLVVAADDGVMPQTVEAIHHAKAAGVSIVIALNKCDLPGCDFNRIYAQFAEHELTPVEWGGKTEVVKTSAITGEGIDSLLEHLDYTTELLELKADDTIPATGWVVEASMSAQRGVVATLLIGEGQLKKGDIILAGCAYGRVKAMRNSFSKSIKTAISAMPVEITGLNCVPQAGDKFYCLDEINKAKLAAEENMFRLRENSLAKRTQVTMDNLFGQIEAGSIKELNIIIRADVQGSVDVLMKYLTELNTDEVKIKILHAAPGGITEGDVVLAEASNAIIIGFNVSSEERVSKIAEDSGVDIRRYNIIYRITEDLKKSMAGLLDPEEKEESVGRATVRDIFKVSKLGTVAGCFVTSGLVKKNVSVRLVRDNIVLKASLTIESLRHFKNDAKEVRAGMECGVKLNKFDDVKIGDVLEFYEVIKIARTL